MKFTKEQQEFLKQNKEMIKSILKEAEIDYLNRIVDEPDPQKKEVLSLFVKEFRLGLLILENLSKLDNKKGNVGDNKPFTGI